MSQNLFSRAFAFGHSWFADSLNRSVDPIEGAVQPVVEMLEARQLFSSAVFTFDDGSGSTAADSSGNGNNATLHGGAAFTSSGHINGAITLNGSTGYLDATSSSDLQTSGAVTVAAWVKLGGTETDQKIASTQDLTAGGYKLGIFDGKVEFEIRDSSNQYYLDRSVTGGTALSTGVWYHVAGVWDPTTGTISTYVNGALDRQLTTTGTLAVSGGDLIIGRDGTADSGYLDGSLDDLRIYQSALTASQISDLYHGIPLAPTNLSATAGDNAVTLDWTGNTDATSYNIYRGTSAGGESGTPLATGITLTTYTDSTASNGTTYFYTVTAVDSAGASPQSNEASSTPDVSAGPLSWFTFDEGSGSTTTGTGSAGSLTGTLEGGVSWTSGSHSGSALSFDGSSGYVSVPSSTSLDLAGTVTVSAWVKINSDTGDMKILGNETGAGGGYKLGILNGQAEFEIRDASDQYYNDRFAGPGTTLTPGVWYQVTGVYSQSGGYIKTYVNGVLDRYLATTGVLAAGTGDLVIGKEPFAASGYFNGSIDDVQIYSAALTSAQVKGIAGVAPIPDGPVNLSATFSGTTATVSWTNADPTATGFVVQYSGDGGTTWSSPTTYSSSTTSVTLIGLPATTSVLVEVLAQTGLAISLPSTVSGITGAGSEQYYTVTVGDPVGGTTSSNNSGTLTASTEEIQADSPAAAIEAAVTGTITADLSSVPGIMAIYTYTFPTDSSAFAIEPTDTQPDGVPYPDPGTPRLQFNQTTGKYNGYIGLEDETDAPINDMDYNDFYFPVTVTPVP